MLKIAIPSFAVPESYRDALLQTAGTLGLPLTCVFVTAADREAPEGFLTADAFDVRDFDGLLLPGGCDLDPSGYGEPLLGSVGLCPELDKLQFALLDAFVKAGKPVMGICRGHQLINVYFGGTLIQDLPEKAAHAPLGGEPNHHEVLAEEGSLLSRLYGPCFLTNSTHHQAVKQAGVGLRRTAMSPDGVVEALEHESLPVFSVQFHPERMCFACAREDTADGSRLLEAFLKRLVR